MQTNSINEIQFEDFLKIDIRAGSIIEAKPNQKAKKPAYILTINFGKLGIKISSAQITEKYKPEQLIGKQVLAVVNFPVKHIAGIKSEVLVLACIDELSADAILLQPSFPVLNGSRVL